MRWTSHLEGYSAQFGTAYGWLVKILNWTAIWWLTWHLSDSNCKHPMIKNKHMRQHSPSATQRKYLRLLSMCVLHCIAKRVNKYVTFILIMLLIVFLSVFIVLHVLLSVAIDMWYTNSRKSVMSLCFFFEPRYLTRYRAGLQAGRSGFDSRKCKIFFFAPQSPDLLWGPSVKLTTHLHFVPRSRMVELYLQSLPHMSSWRGTWLFKHRDNFTLILLRFILFLYNLIYNSAIIIFILSGTPLVFIWKYRVSKFINC
jgi:hypothetical protein